MATLRQDLGPVTAYAYAVSEGYTGTEEEFAEVLANFADSAEQVAADAAQVALDKGAVHDDKEAVDSAEGRVTSAVNTFTTTTAPNAVTAVENAGTAQIGLVEAEGTRQIGLVADKGTEQVGTVSSEGTTQIGLVEAKGAEVIASIPGDYSTLQGDIASTYSSSSTYAVGDYVLYSGQLYRCTTAISTAEAWTSEKWTAVALGDDVSDLKSAFDDLKYAVAADSDFINIHLPFVRGWLGSEGFVNNSKTWATNDYISTDEVDTFRITDNTLLAYVKYYDNNKASVKTDSLISATGVVSIDKMYPYFRTCIGYLSSTDIVPKSALDNYLIRKDVTSEKNTVVPASSFSTMWVKGGINGSTGALTYSSLVSYITPSFIDKQIKKISPNAGYCVSLAAYENGSYVGMYNGSTFVASYSVRTNPVDVAALRESYPTYDYRILALKLTSEDIGILDNIIITYDRLLNKDSISDNDFTHTFEQARNARRNSNKPLTILHFSDIHGDVFRLSDIVAFRDRFSAYIDDTICTGDLVAGQVSDGVGFWSNTDGTDNILTCVGNHDAVTAQSGGEVVDMDVLCDMLIDPFISNWGAVTHPTDATYYYKDYNDQKVRLIVLDCMHSTNSAQIEWLQNALSDAITNSLHVIIGIHYPAYPRTIIECDFSPLINVAITGAGIASAILNAVDSFQTNGGKFVCYLTGHEHQDFILTPDNYPNQLVVSITCATNVNSQFYLSDQYRYGDFANAVNVVTVNTTEQVVSIKRMGADMDMCLRDRKTFSYDYNNHELLK